MPGRGGFLLSMANFDNARQSERSDKLRLLCGLIHSEERDEAYAQTHTRFIPVEIQAACRRIL